MTISDPTSQTRAVPADRTDVPAEPPRDEPVASVRRTAWTLSLLGLLPFAVMAALLLYAGREFIAFSQLILGMSGYSAVILAFLGGVRWGSELLPSWRRRRTVVLSVLPALVGWVLLFVPSPWMFAGFAAAFTAMGVWDFLASRGRTLPTWFGTLRATLTIVVVICQAAAFFSTFG